MDRTKLPAIGDSGTRKKHTVHGILNLKEPPRDLGNAYMMRVPSLVGGTKHITVSGITLPGRYQFYNSELNHPYGWEAPHTHNPAGSRRHQPENSRCFQTVRHVSAADLHKREQEEKQREEAKKGPVFIEPSKTLAEASLLGFQDTLLLDPSASASRPKFSFNETG